MPVRHISKPGPRTTYDDLWRMTYCGTSQKVTLCVSLGMYMRGFFEKVQYKPEIIDTEKFYSCAKCVANIDGLDLLNTLP